MTLALVAVLVPPATAARPPSTLNVDVTEWAIVPSTGLVDAGPTHLVVHNVGRIRHAIVVLRTRRWGEELALQAGRPAGHPVGSTLVVAPGATRSETVTLAPGTYEVADTLPGHYANRAWVAIAVR